MTLFSSNLQDSGALSDALENLRHTRNNLRSSIRSFYGKARIFRDQRMHYILSSNPQNLYRAMASHKSTNSSGLQQLNVGGKLFMAVLFPLVSSMLYLH